MHGRHLLRARPFYASGEPAIISDYDDVRAVMLAPAGTWCREVPLDVVPAGHWHCILDASWMKDGETHRRLMAP